MNDTQEFYKWLIEQAHTAIFQWVTVWLASGIGLVQIIQTIPTVDNPDIEQYLKVIYIIVTFLMVFSIYSIFNIIKNQNKWANQMQNDIRDIFLTTRGISGTLLKHGWLVVVLIILNLGFCLYYFRL